MIKTEMSTNAAYMILWGEIMMVRHFLDVEEVTSLKGANGVSKRTLLGKGESAPNFYLRRFRIEAGGNTPQHAHPWEHEIYVVGKRHSDGGRRGSRHAKVAVLIPTGQEHQIRPDRKP